MIQRFLSIALLLVATACGGSLPASGTPEAEALARTHVTRGQHEYSIGRFVAAIDEYTKAYDLYPSPVLLFNIGQCYRELRVYERAIFFYTGYLRDEPHASNRSTVEQLITEAREAAGAPATPGTR
jgi:tetratricopeptide (TPR) repeat protein